MFLTVRQRSTLAKEEGARESSVLTHSGRLKLEMPQRLNSPEEFSCGGLSESTFAPLFSQFMFAPQLSKNTSEMQIRHTYEEVPESFAFTSIQMPSTDPLMDSAPMPKLNASTLFSFRVSLQFSWSNLTFIIA